MKNYPFWKNSLLQSEQYPSLTEDISSPVCIVGGGITGITLARLLADAGAEVCVIEADKVGSGTTGYSSGNLYVTVDKHYSSLLNKFGEETVRKVTLARQGAFDLIFDLAEKHQIPCDINLQPWYFFTENEEDVEKITDEAKSLNAVGLQTEVLDDAGLGFSIKKAVKLSGQARFNPFTYVTSLAKTLEGSSCRIFENTRVLNIKEEEDYCIVETSGGTVKAGIVVMATHLPINFNVLQTIAIPYRSYVCAYHLNDGDYPEGVFWDTEDPYHAISTHKVGEEKLLIVVGGDHKVGQADDHEKKYTEVDNYARKHFNIKEMAYRWSAQHYRPVDGLPYIGRSPFSSGMLFSATGFSGDGLVYGTMAAQILSDILQSRKNPYADIFDSTRVTLLQSAAYFLKENANVAAQYVKDYATTPGLEVFDEIQKGEGIVAKINDQKVAAYRSEKGELFLVSPVCTHLKCIVHWNNAEKSWDCPCHGSRFGVNGEVIEGPATKPLGKVDLE